MTKRERLQCCLAVTAEAADAYVDHAPPEELTHALNMQSVVRLALIQVGLRPVAEKVPKRRAS